MDFIKKNKNYIIWAGCIIIAVACFLTFMKMSAYGQSEGIKFNELTKDGNDLKLISGYFVLAAAVVSAVLVFLKKYKFSLISTAVALVITFYDYFKINGDSSIKAVKAFGAKISYVAPWVVLVGVVLAVVPVIMTWKDED